MRARKVEFRRIHTIAAHNDENETPCACDPSTDHISRPSQRLGAPRRRHRTAAVRVAGTTRGVPAHCVRLNSTDAPNIVSKS
eukprot:scaffold5680_cov122-Isochrysis_galbana.AAC.6